MMRVRYMISTDNQAAWGRFDMVIQSNILNKPFCPGMVGTVYSKVKNMMSSAA